MSGLTRISVKQAAEELQTTPLTLRYLMAEGMVDIGYCVARPGQYHRHFVIYRESLDKELERRGLRKEGKCIQDMPN